VTSVPPSYLARTFNIHGVYVQQNCNSVVIFKGHKVQDFINGKIICGNHGLKWKLSNSSIEGHFA